jgi:hypothetical protein
MELNLTFANGNLRGDGLDDVGRFLIQGRYDAASHECYWAKSYLGAHAVFYRGFREEQGHLGHVGDHHPVPRRLPHLAAPGGREAKSAPNRPP